MRYAAPSKKIWESEKRKGYTSLSFKAWYNNELEKRRGRTQGIAPRTNPWPTRKKPRINGKLLRADEAAKKRLTTEAGLMPSGSCVKNAIAIVASLALLTAGAGFTYKQYKSKKKAK